MTLLTGGLVQHWRFCEDPESYRVVPYSTASFNIVGTAECAGYSATIAAQPLWQPRSPPGPRRLSLTGAVSKTLRRRTLHAAKGGTLRLIVFCILVASCGNLIAIGAPAEEDAATAGQKWLSLVDAEKYKESWNQASSMFRREVTEEQWLAALKRSRAPLGSLVSRTASRVEFSKFLRGAPEGEYAIIHFSTAFTNKNATERLTLVKEDGRWQTAAYGIY
jgi:Protein of unknown function (DUF4019)